MTARRAVLFGLLAGCAAERGQEELARPDILRVSAHGQLDSLNDLTFQSASASYLDLVYLPGSKIFGRVSNRSPGVYFLEQKPGASIRANQVRHADLVKATDAPGGVEVELSSRSPPALDDFLLDIGPYMQETFTPRRITLRRRVPGSPAVIEVLSMSSEAEEWRRFLAREVDVVPLALPGQVSHLSELPSVRIVYYAQPSGAALYFRTDSGPFADAEARRRVSTGIRRKAIAFATGDPEGTIPAREAAYEPVPGPNIRLLFDVSRSDLERASLVLEEQLLELGYGVTIKGLESQQLVDAFVKQDFELVTMQGGYTKRYLDRARSGEQANVTGYANPEYDRAVEGGDDVRAIELLDRDVPFTPLYSLRDAAAVDRRFCGARPEVSSDFTWLASVHPCEPGEHQ